MDNSDVKNAAGCFIVVFGVSFVLTSIGLILALVTGSSLSGYFLEEDGESGFGFWQAQFWIVVVAVIVLLLAGGELKNLRILEDFPYKDKSDEDEDRI